MIRFTLEQLIAEKSFQEDRRITLTEISKKTGISRRVLTAVCNEKGYVTTTDTLDKLCSYLGCSLSDLAAHVPDTRPPRTRP